MHPHMSELTLIAAGDDFCTTLHPKPQLQVREEWRGVLCDRASQKPTTQEWRCMAFIFERPQEALSGRLSAGGRRKARQGGSPVEQACWTSASAHGRPACYRNGTEMVDLDLARLGAEDK